MDTDGCAACHGSGVHADCGESCGAGCKQTADTACFGIHSSAECGGPTCAWTDGVCVPTKETVCAVDTNVCLLKAAAGDAVVSTFTDRVSNAAVSMLDDADMTARGVDG